MAYRALNQDAFRLWLLWASVYRGPRDYPSVVFGRLGVFRIFVLSVSLFCMLGSELQAWHPGGHVSLPAEDKTDGAKDDVVSAESVVLAEGQVLDPLGSGCKGVTIKATWKGESKPFFEGLSKDFGDFKITHKEKKKGTIAVQFEFAGFGSVSRETEVGVDEWPAYIDVQLKGTLTFAGRVVSHLDQKPIEGAFVSLSLSFSEFEATTGADGRFSFGELAPTRGKIVIQAEGFGRESQPIEITKDTSETVTDFELKPERVVTLRARNQDGEPVSQVVIEAVDQEHQDYRTVMTDTSGQAELKQLNFDAAYLQVRYSHPDYVSSNEFGREFAMPSDSATSEHELVLKRAGRIKGVITHGPFDEPVSGARVITGAMADDASPRAWSNYKGEYEVTGIPAGDAVVTIHARGFAPQLQRVAVEAGKSHEVEIKLEKGAVLQGVVLDSNGDPAPRAFIMTGKWRGAATLGLRAEAGKDGRFTIEDMPSGEVSLTVFGARGGSIEQVVTAGGEPVTLTLPKVDPVVNEIGSGPKIGDVAPTFSVRTTLETAIASESLSGKIVLLDFWATWCGPCLAEMPTLIKIHEAYGSRDDFVMLGISLDQSEASLTRFVAKRKIGWEQVFGDSASALAQEYGVRGIPAVYLIGGDGKVLAANLRGDALESAVSEALGDGE